LAGFSLFSVQVCIALRKHCGSKREGTAA
jgi:hypothetical protein